MFPPRPHLRSPAARSSRCRPPSTPPTFVIPPGDDDCLNLRFGELLNAIFPPPSSADISRIVLRRLVVSRPQHVVGFCGLPSAYLSPLVSAVSDQFCAHFLADSDRPQRPKKCEIDVNCAEVRAGSSR